MPPPAAITAWPVPADVKDVILVGGTFDPPHKAHIELPVLIRGNSPASLLRNAWLLFIPAARSPLKSNAPRASGRDRTRMLELALNGFSNATVWTDELDRDIGTRSFTFDTVTRAGLVAPPGTRFRLFLGADQAVAFHTWAEFRTLLALAPPLVALRPPVATVDSLLMALRQTNAWNKDELERWRASCESTVLDSSSSTDVRDAIARDDWSAARHLLHEPVFEFVRQRGLYTVKE